MSTRNGFQTSADVAYELICSQILAGDLPPGAKLSRRKMAELTGVSIIPVIEALHRLETEGLVESKPQWGSRVIELTPDIIQDRYALREAVECQVVRILCNRLSEEDFAVLNAMAQRLDECQVHETIGDVYWDEHYAFHFRLAQHTNHPSLVEALHRINLFNLLEKAELAAQKIHAPIPADNHQRVVKAIESGDPDTAEREMREHIFQSGLAIRED